MNINGYEMVTTFPMDFTIAEAFGIDGIKDTFNRAFMEWKGNYVYLTELVITLNHKIWQWFEINDQIARLYDELWRKADAYAIDNLKDDELSFFLSVTD